MPRIAALAFLAAFAAALAFVGCGGKKDVADAAETAGEGPASTAAPYEAETGPEGETNAETLLETRCTLCHTLERVEKKKVDRAGWEKIVERMKEHGAKLDDDEREALVEYLTVAYGK
jgi:cytochrome c5